MAKSKTKTKISARRGDGTAHLEPIDNKRIRMSADIEKMVRARQRKAHEVCAEEAALYAAASLSPEERARRNVALAQIARNLGIHDELLALRAVARSRAQRLGKLLGKASRAAFVKRG